MQHTSAPTPDEISFSQLHIGAAAAKFWASTGNIFGYTCTLDVDGNNVVDPLTDGVMLLRAMFGLTGTAVTNDALGISPTRSTWAQIQPFLNSHCGTNFLPGP